MEPTDEQQLADFLADAEGKQRRRRHPQRISDVVSRLMARKGYAQLQQADQWSELMRHILCERLGRDCRATVVKRGVLEILTRNSTVLQELTFQKKRLLRQLQQAEAGKSIRDLRFKVGQFD